MKDKREVRGCIGINGGAGPACVEVRAWALQRSPEPGDMGLPRPSTDGSPSSPQAALTHPLTLFLPTSPPYTLP